MTTAELIRKIEEYRTLRGWAGATLTREAVGNSRLYQRLKNGKSCTLDVAERLCNFMEENPPPSANPGREDAA